MSWWELTGRTAVGVPLFLTGAALLAAEAGRLRDPGGCRISVLVAVMSAVGLLQAAAGLAALAGRMALPLLVSLFAVGVPLLRGLLPVAHAPEASLWTLGYIVDLVTLAWLLAWLLRRRWGGAALVRGMAVPLGIGLLLSVPSTARFLGQAGSRLFLAPRPDLVYDVGDRVGAVRFTGQDGAEISLDEAHTVYVVNFWARWCGPCMAELPDILGLQRRYRRQERVRFLAVNCEDLDPAGLEAFLRERKLEGLAAATDTHGVQDRLGIDSIPATLVIRDRTILARIRGYRRDLRERLREEIEGALAGES